MNYEQVICILIFLAVYAAIAIFHRFKAIIAWTGVALMVIMSVMPILKVPHYINWNILGIFWGSLVIAELFVHSRVPAYLAETIIDHSKSVVWAIIWLSAFGGIISAFVENIATVLIIAPIAFEVSRKLKTSPVPFILGLVLSSNLQGTATLVGDPPSMILASAARMTFNDFFFFQGKPSLFFAVEFSAVISLIVLFFLFRRQREKIKIIKVEKITSLVPSFFLALLIIGLAIGSSMRGFMDYLGGTICVVLGLIALSWSFFSQKIKTFNIIKDTDWETFFFLAAIFVLVGTLTETRLTVLIAELIGNITGGSLLTTYIMLVLFSVIISAFVDNVPYFAAMVSVIMLLSQNYNYPIHILLFGTIIGTTIGGNITPIGAAANIVGVGLLKKNGYNISFLDFARVGMPFTIAAVTFGAFFIWIFWS
ncbi:hypothetical protein A2Y85_03610 [candidate division WOR-3 bacterium RBG_13_43_14]|uniref:Citrate transporter-like domain-containing protein n=1 Tax=candidate division WOR-3 bacterium RBG_13_43_14 TaxID=1802590 RepID=A0A1F4U3K0_UNCW3|nr:MAG: hypothetical protein A2Y85_03610 [candidate division WOR-3 bacterium RBG_13_43_14]